MKKYNRIIILSLLLYVVCAAVSGYIVNNANAMQGRKYRVEINQVMKQLESHPVVEDIDVTTYEYIQEIAFLKNDITDQKTIEAFYVIENKQESKIQPLYKQGILMGYVKCIYQIPTIDTSTYFFVLQGTLALLEIFVLCILYYLKTKVVVPFTDLNDLSLQLAKGHFDGVVIEEKSQYLGQFVRGIGQLKDSLAVSKKRELELLKEKKKMILSLSHDIKTPLNVIKLYGKAINEKIYTTKQQKYEAIEQINEKVVEIEKYVNEIIQSSREDILDLEVVAGEFYLKDMLEKVLKNYQDQCALRHMPCLVHRYENKLLKGDIDRSQEVLENILENALKYGDGRSIEISFYEEDNCQVIAIYNTGNPVTDNDFNHIFDSFFRGTNSKGQQGSGLGLYICRELMRKMDGTIFAKKEEDGMSLHVVFRT